MKSVFSESAIQGQIIDYLRTKGWWVMRLNAGNRYIEGKERNYCIKGQEPGTPDLLCHKLVIDDMLEHNHGIRHESVKLVYLEIKIPGKSPTPLQRFMMTKLQGYGAKCYVVHSVEEVMQLGL